MDQFRTEVTPAKAAFGIEHSDAVMLIGSCFAESMAERLADSKFRVSVNPFGILFNPFSVVNALSRISSKRYYKEEDLVQVGDQWVSLDHHGSFNASDSETVLEAINKNIDEAHETLKKAKVLFVTTGTAWVYHHTERDQTVANCHKIPNTAFEKRLLSNQDTHLILRHIPQLLERLNPGLQIVFTVSPVRHWKDGAIENQRSKAQLVAASHAVVDEYEQCHYFPSYELLMDDLRDYRFYKTDMLHPTDQAVDYVWGKFGDTYFSNDTRAIMEDVKGLMQAVKHRPVDPESNSFQRFVKNQLELIQKLEARHPSLDLQPQRSHFERYRL